MKIVHACHFEISILRCLLWIWNHEVSWITKCAFYNPKNKMSWR